MVPSILVGRPVRREVTTTDIAMFRVRKREALAILTLADGRTVRGAFFLSETAAGHAGPERIDEVLNAATRFVPFHVDADTGRHDRSCRPECDFHDRTPAAGSRIVRPVTPKAGASEARLGFRRSVSTNYPARTRLFLIATFVHNIERVGAPLTAEGVGMSRARPAPAERPRELKGR